MTSLGKLSNFNRKDGFLDLDGFTDGGRKELDPEVMSTTSKNHDGESASLKVRDFLEGNFAKS
jgi:hypothetical protein